MRAIRVMAAALTLLALLTLATDCFAQDYQGWRPVVAAESPVFVGQSPVPSSRVVSSRILPASGARVRTYYAPPTAYQQATPVASGIVYYDLPESRVRTAYYAPANEISRVAQAPYYEPADQQPRLTPVAPAGASLPNGRVIAAASYPVDCGAPVAAPVPYRVSAYRPLLPIRNVPPSTYIGPGIVGQPTAYVPGQPVRNFLRYVTP